MVVSSFRDLLKACTDDDDDDDINRHHDNTWFPLVPTQICGEVGLHSSLETEIAGWDALEVLKLHGFVVVVLAAIVAPSSRRTRYGDDLTTTTTSSSRLRCHDANVATRLCRILQQLYARQDAVPLLRCGGATEAFAVVVQLCAEWQAAPSSAWRDDDRAREPLQSLCLSLLAQMAPVAGRSVGFNGEHSLEMMRWWCRTLVVMSTPETRHQTLRILDGLASAIHSDLLPTLVTARSALMLLQGHCTTNVELDLDALIASQKFSVELLEYTLLGIFQDSTFHSNLHWTTRLLLKLNDPTGQGTEDMDPVACLLLLTQSLLLRDDSRIARKDDRIEFLYSRFHHLLRKSGSLWVKRLCACGLAMLMPKHPQLVIVAVDLTHVRNLVQVILVPSPPAWLESLQHLSMEPAPVAATTVLLRHMEAAFDNSGIETKKWRHDFLQICLVLLDSRIDSVVTRVLSFVCGLFQDKTSAAFLLEERSEILSHIATVLKRHPFHDPPTYDPGLIQSAIIVWDQLLSHASDDSDLHSEICATIVRQTSIVEVLVQLSHSSRIDASLRNQALDLLIQLSDEVINHCLLARHPGVLAALIRRVREQPLQAPNGEAANPANAMADRGVLKQRIFALASVL